MYISDLKFRLLILSLLFSFFGFSQMGPPSLRCISCNPFGDLTLTWVIPPDPSGQFISYEIYKSNTLTGTYTPIASISTYTVKTYTDVGANGNAQSRYYFMKTIYGSTSTNTSVASDTLRSIYLNLSDPNDGTALLIYNNIHNPRLSTSSGTFSIYRENPGPIWSNVKNTTALSMKDTITLCNVFYNYQVQLGDLSGCISSSNISGLNFKDLIPPDPKQDVLPSQNLIDSVSVSGGVSNIGWRPSTFPDCVGYVIYEFSGGSWKIIDTVYGRFNTSVTTTLSANNVSVKHCIASIDSCKNISPLGSAHSTIFLQTIYNMCERSAELKWNAYSNMLQGLLLYKIYVSVNGGVFTLLGNTSSTEYEHTGLEPGKTYCYQVRAFNTPNSITSTSNRACLVATAPSVSSFVYLHYATVDPDQNVSVSLLCDTINRCKGFNIYRSEDGITYDYNGFIAFNGNRNLIYRDTDVKTNEKFYFYKAVMLDSCGNARYTSNIGKTVMLRVRNDRDKIFNNLLSWDNYQGWQVGVAGYYLYRQVNGVMGTTPVDFIPAGINTYTDNVEDIVQESGKVGYYVTAVENFGNPYGLQGSSASNITEAYVEGSVFVPNAFAPKGENRIWKPVTQFVEKTDYKVSVFNRWGTKVFETTDENQGWDGSGMEDNTYAYILQYKNARGEFIELKGTVTIIR